MIKFFDEIFYFWPWLRFLAKFSVFGKYYDCFYFSILAKFYFFEKKLTTNYLTHILDHSNSILLTPSLTPIINLQNVETIYRGLPFTKCKGRFYFTMTLNLKFWKILMLPRILQNISDTTKILQGNRAGFNIFKH